MLFTQAFSTVLMTPRHRGGGENQKLALSSAFFKTELLLVEKKGVKIQSAPLGFCIHASFNKAISGSWALAARLKRVLELIISLNLCTR